MVTGGLSNIFWWSWRRMKYFLTGDTITMLAALIRIVINPSFLVVTMSHDTCCHRWSGPEDMSRRTRNNWSDSSPHNSLLNINVVYDKVDTLISPEFTDVAETERCDLVKCLLSTETGVTGATTGRSDTSHSLTHCAALVAEHTGSHSLVSTPLLHCHQLKMIQVTAAPITDLTDDNANDNNDQ